MAKVSFIVCLTASLLIAGGSSEASRYLRPSVEEIAAAPCTMHPLNSSLNSSLDTDNGSLQESGTMSIGSKVFNVVDPNAVNTMTIGNKVYKIADVSRSKTKTYSIST
ncbi:hypothetical protein PF005_g25968 [Phytophthora fragariae]|uniref:RxLR effector protein n=2 Tax=Phytophthora TaxID=4783 RepID=A0A6A3W0N7_9STRA|nr:hypothetical protein PF003_g21763 [Phytophthora fragariae]KAE8987623.1 hypothetical protein PR002_g21999 [Phytophthora rubi]KAE8923106.1 hypothetical protein PF009_g26639 [Phytophthora fragariae]KAE8974078.1 hypothetical protein PF011_g25001 [Phytophthora fragariae]KAE9024035.1 hypothetical protein PR001_g12771 [Phytophthora rubi]